MGVILDTSVWIEVERGHLSLADVKAIIGDELVYLAPVTIAELKYGVVRGRTMANRNRRAAAFARVMQKPCLMIDKTTADLFGQIAAELDNSGHASKYRFQDIWIASLAIQHNFPLLTRNERDFANILGLTIIALPKLD